MKERFIAVLTVFSILLCCLPAFASEPDNEISFVSDEEICERTEWKNGVEIEVRYNLQNNELQKDLYLVNNGLSRLIKCGINSYYCDDDLYISHEDKLDKYSIDSESTLTILSGVVLRDISILNDTLYAVDDSNGISQLIATSLLNPEIVYTNYTNVNSFNVSSDGLEIDMRIPAEQMASIDDTTIYVNDDLAIQDAKDINTAQDGLNNLLNPQNEVKLMSVESNTDSIMLNSIVLLSSIQPAMFVMDTLYVTQGAYGSYSHSDDNAFDLDGSLGGGTYDCANVYAPFNGIVKYKETSYNAVWVESNDIVQYANGTTGYMTVLFMHDMDISNIYVGQSLTQKQVFYNEGGKGPKGTTQYGTHLHIECMSGQVGSRGWGARGNVYPNDALFLYPSTNVSNRGGYTWRIWDGAIVQDTEAPTISNVYTSNVSGSSFDINCDLNDNIGVTRVWLNVYGPSGSNGYGVTASNGHFVHTINTSDYGGSGTFTVHIYAYDAAGNGISTNLTNIQAITDNEKPTISNAFASNISSSAFNINCNLSDNVGVTRVWLNVYGPNGSNGYAVSAKDGFFYTTIYTSEYGGSGTYSVHIYAFDAAGNSSATTVSNIVAKSDSEKPVIQNVYASNISSNSFTINCQAYDNVGITRAWLNIYGPSGSNGFAISCGNNFTYTINTADYGGRGTYTVHIYVFDGEGNESEGAAIREINAVSDSESPVITSVWPSYVNSQSFTINCRAYDNVGITRAWLNVYGPNGSKGFGISGGEWFDYKINTADYGGPGTYTVHVYVYDAEGNGTSAAITGLYVNDDNVAPVITSLNVTNISDSSFTINCTTSETVVRGWVNIYGPNGSDGYAIYMYDNNFMHTIDTSKYGGAGDYNVHVYVWDINGNEGAGAATGVFTAANLYTVNYNANGGVNAPSAQTKIKNKPLTLSDVVLTRPGYIFWGWAENNPNATNATYPAGGTFTGNYNATLYAVWRLADYTVLFNANGGTTPVDSKTVTYSGKYGNLPVPSLAGHTFIGWFTEPNGGIQVTEDANITETDNHTLYAQWKKSEYSIEYNMNGGEGYIDSQSILYGINATISNYIPTREGYKFLGWARRSDVIEPEFSSGDMFAENADLTLYAVWKIIPSTETSIIKKSNYSMVNITVHNLDEIAKVVLATYKNGKLSDIQIEEYNGEDLSLATFLPYDTVKVMLWESMGSMMPLANTEILN